MKLSIDKFKKIRTEKDHTVLRHPDGHEIRVLHKPLSTSVRKQLNELPHYDEGGYTNNPKLQEAHKKSPEPEKQQQIQASQIDPARALSIQNSFRSMGMHKYADGGNVKQDPDKAKQAQDSMRQAFHFAEGSPEVPAQVSSNEDDPTHAMLSEAIKNLSSKYINNPTNPPEDTAVPEQASVPVASPEVPQTPVVPTSAPQGTLPEQAQANVEQANQAEMHAAKNIQGAEAEKANIFQQQGEHLQKMQAKYEELGNNLHQQFEKVSDQVQQGHIDPNHWWDSKSTGSQILTAIGMMFAGAGGGVSGHPEMASKAIDEAIDRDIAAQKANLDNKNTLLSKYMEMYRSIPEAEQAARLTLNAGVEGLINQQAAKLGSQNAISAASIANANRRQSVLPQMEGLARGQVMGQMYNQMNGAHQTQPESAEQGYQDKMQNMRILNPDLGKDMEAKYLPNVGIARVPVPDKLREELTTRKDLSDKLAQLENFSREHSGSLDPTTVARGRAMAAQVQDAYRTAHQQGVFKESEKKFLESVLSHDPTVFFSKVRALPGYQEARKFNDQTTKQFYKSYGIKPFDSGHDSGQIRVKLNSSGQTGTIPANEFDPKIYSKVE